ncbi:MAG: thioredoxin family protein [Bacilli bacterium]|nr:thioredoxin family protein [Bacilli bacterium]
MQNKFGKWIVIIFIALLAMIFLFAYMQKKQGANAIVKKAFDSKEAQLIYLARPGCSWCEKQKPVLEATAKKYNFEYSYINTENLDAVQLKEVLKKFEVDINSFGTPTFVVVKDGKVIDSNIGYMEENTFVSFLQSTGMIK